MHYFEDVPKDWRGSTGKVARTPRASAKVEKAKKAKKPAETPSEIKKEKERAKKVAAKKKPTSQVQQGFFFNLLETPAEAPETEPESEVKE